MKELIARLEMAPAASRDLDYEIWRLNAPAEFMGKKIAAMTWHLGTVTVATDDNFVHLEAFSVPHYTGSLDAAAGLVPDGCAWNVGCEIDFTPVALVFGHDIHADADAATPAIALCVAALKSRPVSLEQRSEER